MSLYNLFLHLRLIAFHSLLRTISLMSSENHPPMLHMGEERRMPNELTIGSRFVCY